jgi:hypothetical protein
MPTKRRTSKTTGGKRDHGRQRTALQSRATGRRNGKARRPVTAGHRAVVRDDSAGLAGVAAERRPTGLGGAGALREARGNDPRSALIRGASGAALLLADRLSRCISLQGDCTSDEADGLELDERIARGDRMACYDVIGACIDELTAWRDGLGEVLCDAETMGRIANLNSRRRARGC